MVGYLLLGLLSAGAASAAYVATRKPDDATAPNVSALDKGVTVDEALAVNFALKYEKQAHALEDFGITFQPIYPVTASLLHARALTMDTDGALANALRLAAEKPLTRQLKTPMQPAAMVAKSRVAAWAMKPIPIKSTVSTAGKHYIPQPTLPPDAEYHTFWPKYARDIIPENWSGDFSKALYNGPGWWNSPAYGRVALEAGRMAVDDPNETRETQNRLLFTDVLTALKTEGLAGYLSHDHTFDYGMHRSLGDEISDSADELGKAIKSAGPAIGMMLKALAPIVGLIPGIGSGIAVAMSVAGSLAMGQNISDALLDAAANAVPGGGLVKMAFDKGIVATKGIVKGRSIGNIARDEARALAVDAAGEMGGAAFDAAVALAQGKNLQDAGFQVYYSWVRGNEIAERAGHFAEKAAKAVEQGKSVKDFLIDSARDELASAVKNSFNRAVDVDNAIGHLIKNPELLKGSIEDAAHTMQTSVESAQAAFMCVSDMGNGVVVVNPDVRKRFDSIALLPDRPQGMAESAKSRALTQQMIPKNTKTLMGASQQNLDRAVALLTPMTPDERLIKQRGEERAQWVKLYLAQMRAA